MSYYIINGKYVLCRCVYKFAFVAFFMSFAIFREVTEMKYYEKPTMFIESLEVERAVALSIDSETEGPEVELSGDIFDL